MALNKGKAGIGAGVGTPDSTTEGFIPKKESGSLVDSSIKETDKITISKKTQVGDMVVTNELSAKKIKTAEPSVELGSALTIGAAGGEVIYSDLTTPTKSKHFGPRKLVDIVGGTGTASEFTLGRIIETFSSSVEQAGFSLRSDDPTAQIGENAFDINNVQFLITTASGQDFISRKYLFRFDTIETGIRFVVRKSSRTGDVIFTSTEDFLWELGDGFTSKIYAGTTETETVLDLNENPQLLRENTLYHVTIEKFQGTVVSLGAIVVSEFITYFSRDRADAFIDPVVATSVLNVTSSLVMAESTWYTLVLIDATSGSVNLTLPSAKSGVFSGLPMYVIRIDNTANAVNVLPFAGQDINGASSRALTKQNASITLVPDGNNVKILNERPLYPVGDMLFADTNGEPTTNPLLRWDNSGNIFLVEKTSAGLVAVLGNGKIANNGPNSFIMQHRNFSAADVDVGFGQDNLGKIIIGSNNANIELSTGNQGSILGLTVEDATGNVVVENDLQIKGGTSALGDVLTVTGVDGLCTLETPTVGNVVGPASAQPSSITRFDGSTGELIQDSVVLIDNGGNVIGAHGMAIGDFIFVSDPTAILELESTTRGFLPPRLTNTQRDAITSPAEGLEIYNINTDIPNFRNATEWMQYVVSTLVGDVTIENKLTIQGGVSTPIVAKTADYTFTSSDFTVKMDAAIGNRIANLPTASGINGTIYVLVKTDFSANTVTLNPDGTEKIGKDLQVILRDQDESVMVQSDNVNWVIL